MRRLAVLLTLCAATMVPAQGRDPAAPQDLKPGNNLVLEHIPPIPMAIADAIRPYSQSRSALFADWSPVDRSLLIETRFGETNQVHRVRTPGGARSQLTFFPDRVTVAKYLPGGRSFLLQKDIGGGEWFQIYRQDLDTGRITLLTDGRSRNGEPLLFHGTTRYVYSSTRRNNQDTDLWVADANDPASAHMLLQVQGGGWRALDWSPDGKQLLVVNAKSANNTELYLVDAANGDKRLLTPPVPGAEISYSNALFAGDGHSVYLTTDRDSEFQRLARMDLPTGKLNYLTTSIPWDVDDFTVTVDRSKLAFVTNENGISHLYLLNAATDRYKPLSAIPPGVITSLAFHDNGRDLAFTLNSAQASADVFSTDVITGVLDRWTESETGGLDPRRFVSPTLIHWKSFDGKEISGYFYAPDPVRFRGKRPVIIDIHGGPEGQFRPVFLGGGNYFLNELGIALIEPNVRGSTGFGKTFLASDNGIKRDATYKDINALIDWITAQPNLAADHIMVRGGSYGGHMAWAVSAFYNDRIRCVEPIVGPSNLVTFLQNTEAYRRDLRRVEYGDERDPATRAWMEKWAPVNHVDAMHKPVFAIAGRNDPRVPWTESRQIVDRLNAQGTPTWFLVANDEGHGFAKRANRDFQFAAEVLFIETYLLDGVPASHATAEAE